MLITLKGLVIGQRSIGENSCFLDLFTDKLGMIEVMAVSYTHLTLPTIVSV